MGTLSLHNIEGKVVGQVDLPKSLELPVSRDILWQAVRMYLANQRQGTAQTKTIGEVRGGGRKPWNQKHTGRSRQGSIRSPIWRKGGIVFGPHPRDHRYALPQQIRRAALVNSLRARVSDKAVVAIEDLEKLAPKTKSVAALLHEMKLNRGALLVVDKPSPILARISRNIPKVQVKPASDVTCYDVLLHRQVVVTKAALKQLEFILS